MRRMICFAVLALGVITVGVGAASAAGSPPPSLDDGSQGGLMLFYDDATFTGWSDCSGGTSTLSANGLSGREGPSHGGASYYNGTFIDAGTATFTGGVLTSASLTFTVTAANGAVVKGTWTYPSAHSAVWIAGTCNDGRPSFDVVGDYSATITAPDGSAWHDEGVGEVWTNGSTSTGVSANAVLFNSSEYPGGPFPVYTPTPAPTLPTSKDQCTKDGWKAFSGFKNQGDCVSYVATLGKNAPSGK